MLPAGRGVSWGTGSVCSQAHLSSTLRSLWTFSKDSFAPVASPGVRPAEEVVPMTSLVKLTRKASTLKERWKYSGLISWFSRALGAIESKLITRGYICTEGCTARAWEKQLPQPFAARARLHLHVPVIRLQVC